jgi:hypothetical protein
MDSKYKQVDDDEKFQAAFPRRSSTSTLDSTLLDHEEDARALEPRRKFNPRWMWLAHTVLLSLSFTMFISAFFTRATTLQYVKQFSAYCEYFLAVQS